MYHGFIKIFSISVPDGEKNLNSGIIDVTEQEPEGESNSQSNFQNSIGTEQLRSNGDLAEVRTSNKGKNGQ